MKYISAKQTAEKWGISSAMVRRYCLNGLIPKAEVINGMWCVPENAKKPEATSSGVAKKVQLSAFAKKVKRQKTKKVYHGLYDYLMVDMTYSSNRMASNRLTRGQVENVFRKGKVVEMFEPIKVSDLIEVLNHCRCLDYVLDHVEEKLTLKFIKNLHFMLTNGTVDAAEDRVHPGEYRTKESKRSVDFAVHPNTIDSSMKKLLDTYESKRNIGIEEILDFHVKIERIFPFEDYNGRLGRLIMLKECIRYDVTPFVLDDKRRSRYLDGIKCWDENPEILIEVVAEAQARFAAQIELHEMLERQKKFLAEN